MKIKNSTLFISALLIGHVAIGQVKISDKVNPGVPHPVAILELESETKGLLLPRMSTAARLAIPFPPKGLLVFDTTLCDGYFWDGGDWESWKITFGGGNTLEEAYNQGGAGAGRTINTISGAIDLINTGQNTNLVITNTTQKGVDVQTTSGTGIKISSLDGIGLDVTSGILPAIQINKTNNGEGINAFTSMNNAKDLVYSKAIGNMLAGTNFLKPGARAGLFETDNNSNTVPALQGNARGHGLAHGVAGITSLVPAFTNLVVPPSGVAGFSFITSSRRNGLSGYSVTGRGAFGQTGNKFVWGTHIDSMQSGFFGKGKEGPDTTLTGSSDVYAGGIGTVSLGVGLFGNSDGLGHGVIGATMGDGTLKTQAGVWGMIRDKATWPLHAVDFPFADLTTNKGKLGVLGQVDDHIAIWAESLKKIGLVTTVGAKQALGTIGPFKAGILSISTLPDAMAGGFFTDFSDKPGVLMNSKSSIAALEINQTEPGHGIWTKKLKDGIGWLLEMPTATNPAPAIKVDYFGLDKVMELNHLNTMSPTSAFKVKHTGMGRAGEFEIDKLESMERTLTAVTNGLGGAGLFYIVRPMAAMPKNMEAALTASTDAEGGAAFFAVTNAAAKKNAVEISTEAPMGLFVNTKNDTASANANTFLNESRGHTLHLENSNTSATSKALFHVESVNGFTAHFDQNSTSVSRTDPTVLISTARSATGHTALKITTPPACTGCFAAVLEGKLEVSKDTKLGGKLDVDGETTIDNKLNVNGETTLDGSVTATSGMSVTGTINTTTLIASGNVTAATYSANVKMFNIPHPLDEINKRLVHASTESNEYLVHYTGNIVTDTKGFAEVVMPDYVNALAENFRYHLTIIDKDFAQAIIYKEMDNSHSFTIRTDKPGMKVSWQLTGVRKDTWVKQNPLVVEQ